MPGWWPCPECCARPCVIFEDDFERGDSTDLGGSWDEKVGDSEIDDNELLIPASGLVIATKKHPLNTPTCQVTATLTNMQAGRKYRLICNYDYDDGSYIFAEYETTGAGTGTMKVGSNNGSDDSILDEYPAGFVVDGDLEFSLCRTLNGIWCTLQDEPNWVGIGACVGDTGGRYVGVMNASASGDITVDDFVFIEHDHTNRQLPHCAWCPCEGGGDPWSKVGVCIPKELFLLVFAGEDCACMDQTSCILTFDDATRAGPFAWKGTIVVPGCETYNFIFSCTSDGTSVKLCTDKCEDWGDMCTEGYLGGEPISASWDPLELWFHGEGCLPVSVEDPNCTMYFRVTE